MPEEIEYCEQCGDVIDALGENGYCFDCLMASCTSGNHSNGNY